MRRVRPAAHRRRNRHLIAQSTQSQMSACGMVGTARCLRFRRRIDAVRVQQLSTLVPADGPNSRPELGVAVERQRACTLPFVLRRARATRSVSGPSGRERARAQCLIWGRESVVTNRGEGERRCRSQGAVLRALRHEFVTVTRGGKTRRSTRCWARAAQCCRSIETLTVALQSSWSTRIRKLRSPWGDRVPSAV